LDAIPYALTQHVDKDAAGTLKDPIETLLYTDGLKRVLQTKKDASIHNGPDSTLANSMVVSGRVTFDFIGRAIEQFYPVTEPKGANSAFNTAFDSVTPTRMDYDILDRNTRTTIPDGTSTSIAHGFGTDRVGLLQFQTTVTDANSKQKQTYRDVRELITTVKEFNQGTALLTSYAYDPLKQIVKVIDDKNNTTTVAYDNFGRRTIIDNPDLGKTETVYDLASNVTAKITANLRAAGQQISYDYDFTRLKSITYPNFPANNVTYTYGAPSAPNNSANRVTKATSEAGSEERAYGPLGEMVKQTFTINSDTQGNSANSPEVYTTLYQYDTWNRLLKLTYPDGEILTYAYDSGGLVNFAQGKKSNFTYDYVNRLEYDKFEQRAFLEAGNQVRTSYTYRPDNRRLTNLKAGKGNGNLFQNLNYGYDNVGNITALANDVPIPTPNQFGGPTNQTFGYDDLYRLTQASGTYQFSPSKTDRYTLAMSYDSIHNIISKQQAHEIVQPSGQPITQKKTSYVFNYAYNSSGPSSTRPHAPIHIGNRTFNYDADGNQLGWDNDDNGTRRTIVWDEENRIQSLFDNGHEKTYKYDDNGQRIIKRGPQGETVYVNQWFTIRNREVGTKHVFLGTTRAVSKLMKQDKPGANPNGNTPIEKDLFFFHPDHLGSSNYITDTNGKLFEHLEYFAFGETWVEEATNTQRTPFLFTGKELDEETGLYYFGARYFDPRTSIWQSADPMLGSYLAGKVNAGVFNPRNLGLYSYTYNNPLVLADPDGRAPLDASKWTGREPLYSGPVSAPTCKTVSCNSGVYDTMDTSLATGRIRGATGTDWFKAASLVTEFRGLGSLDFPNIMSTDADEYLTSVHHSLAKENYATFDALLSGAGYHGLRGKALDYALVDKEQSLVTKFSNEYFGKNTAARDKVFGDINKFFDPTNWRFSLASEPTRNVINERFQQKGRKFDIGNESDRRRARLRYRRLRAPAQEPR
jgi:RHS repeat-associated protein